MHDMSQDKQNQLQQMAENLQFRVETIPNGKIWLTEIRYPFFTFDFDSTSEIENFLRKESSGFKERTGSEKISHECPFCYAFLGSDGCRHKIVDMCFDVPPIWCNGFEVLETILMYYESYDCGAAHEGFFDWRECLYKLSLEKVVEKNELSELDPTKLFGLLDGVEIVTNLRTGDMTTGYFFHACVSDDKRDFWLKEFEILSNRIQSRFSAEDWEGQLNKPYKPEIPSLIPGAWAIDEAQIEANIDDGSEDAPDYIPLHELNFSKCFYADSLDKAVENMLAHPELALIYRFHGKGSSTHLTVDVTWPLMRRARGPLYEERDFRASQFTGRRAVPDDTIFEIWRTRKGMLILKVGGRSKNDARRNWEQITGQIRKFIKLTDIDSLDKCW